MTESGQEPPGIGRRTADASGKNGTRSEFSGSNRRRRKRRSGQGPKGGTAAENRHAASPGDTANDGQPRHDSGHVEKTQSSQDGAPPAHRDGAKRRKKRRRGRSDSQTRPAGLAEAATHHPQNPDAVTSPKGKKAANRRGRRRWQASKNARNGHGSKPEIKEAAAPLNSEQGSAQPAQILKSDIKAPEGRAPRNPSPAHLGKTNIEKGVRGRRFRISGNRSPLYAALDLGTNNCRLLIARPEERGFRVVDAYSAHRQVGGRRRLKQAAQFRCDGSRH